MGLVTKRNLQLEKLFDQFAVDPKKKHQKPTDKDEDKKDGRDQKADKD